MYQSKSLEGFRDGVLGVCARARSRVTFLVVGLFDVFVLFKVFTANYSNEVLYILNSSK